ncbi:PAS domain-containing protein [Rhodobacterales bacterium HKCCE2091]|nr:PAS domain-containing protein [Rhodobacterales bacterium HKCCE2091]
MDESRIALLDLIRHPVFVIERNDAGIPVFAVLNAAARDTFGELAEGVIGREAREILPERTGHRSYSHHVAAFETGEERSYETFLTVHGRLQRLQTTLVPETDAEGNVARLVGSWQLEADVEAIEALRLNAETLNSDLENFISMAAHDLRAPMRHVTRIADMLREDFQDLGDGKLELIDMLENVGQRAMDLIGGLLDHAQCTSTTEQVQTFDFGDMVAEVLALLDPESAVGCTYDTGRIHGDRAGTLVVLRNLVDNAIKYAAPGDGGPIQLQITLAEGDGTFAVAVADNGAGFAPRALTALECSRSRAGSGFGLRGVGRLLRARGGTLLAGNRGDAPGAQVTFTLPGAVVTSGKPAELRVA